MYTAILVGHNALTDMVLGYLTNVGGVMLINMAYQVTCAVCLVGRAMWREIRKAVCKYVRTHLHLMYSHLTFV